MKVLELTRGCVAILDDEDFERVAQYRWQVNKYGYAIRRSEAVDGKRVPMLMHRIILGVTDKNIHVDHANKNKLDNRRCNLRLATRGQNRANSGKNRNNKSGFKGVYIDKRRKKNQFSAQIRGNGSIKWLGYFPTPQEAHAAYCKAATIEFGEFARFN